MSIHIPGSDQDQSIDDSRDEYGHQAPASLPRRRSSTQLPPTGRRNSGLGTPLVPRTYSGLGGSSLPFIYPKFSIDIQALSVAGTPQANGRPQSAMSDYGHGPSITMTPLRHYDHTPVPMHLQMGTPHSVVGRQLLTKNIADMHLPPEDWADEVRDLNAQVEKFMLHNT